ncbi:protein FAR-RED IMPAIRED RESPONSE 1-like [Olea europaea var. sylvestris]|uniref:protein FAR-RED IMPAIRED RESPONSE 1-like n=1 Tax=Olea europaea var. sylvestris TaxID=158386 RepID=UPI000C1D142D|nr:protein FAR-RED IMPAIRED RESPONSE 1-like [Olea europaea var. sylvestris]
MVGIPLHKSYNSAVIEAGGYKNTTFVEKDCRNYIEQVRRLRLGEGDALAIQAYFSKMQTRCSGFYFSMDLDDDCRLKNVFWADNRCRQSYREFALNAIITDQDRAMQNVIQITLPNTKHRWCLWHIMKKLPEKFGYHIEKSSIFFAIHGPVYDVENVQEFERGWRSMLDMYDLHDNAWLSGLYENRGRWVPYFLKTTFWAGMSTTQRSESMNAFFDGYVHSKTSLKQFVEQYERVLRNKVEKEFQADFRSYSQMVPCTTTYEMEKQFQAVYTIEKFKEIQQEFIEKVYYDVVSENANDYYWSTYEVREDVVLHEHHKKKSFCVSFRRDTCELIFSCHLFEFRGIICRHAITILIRNDITSMPERYILRRWRRDVTRAHSRIAVHYDGLVNSPGQLRYDEMC